ncbi:MAG TPA: metallophosphoesterase [Bacteroidales bacterium]|nr:metallophosphoesterase [Bacteroidales bacterium]
MTRILIIGDVHTHYSAFVNLVNNTDVDIVLQVGDLGLYSDLNIANQDTMAIKHSPKLIKSFIYKLKNNALKKLNKSVYFVKGNHDDYSFIEKQEFRDLGFIYIYNGTVVNIKDINILGFGGIYSPVQSTLSNFSLRNRSKRFFTEEDLMYTTNNVVGKKIDIALLHAAPTGVLPNFKEHEEGLALLNKVLAIANPKLVIHGHHHVNYINNNVIGLGNFCKNKNSYRIIDI